ncbi:hypothetical protein [Bacillus xiapuensis]|uniref:DUF4878 domain-containing protein n=1 Tax=Bacillus xiapuensis TaxID=2014075 RepID=A0ABU6N5J7_9BACI|nr:DUF4878 domain-containing protein [Bacillus xiapuensis]
MKLKSKRNVIIGLGLLIALSAIFLVAFKDKHELTPAETILAYHEKAKAGAIEDTKEYVSEQVLKDFESGKYWHYGSYNNFVADYAKNTISVRPVTKTETINGMSATIEVQIVTSNQMKKTEKYYLVKEWGKWRIAK